MKLNSAEDAVRQAIEGGWKGEGAKFNSYVEMFHDIHWYRKDGYAENCSLEEALFDPLFWQALGKARGWKNESEFESDESGVSSLGFGGSEYIWFNGEEWKYHSIEWFLTRMSNGDEKAFWQSLP